MTSKEERTKELLDAAVRSHAVDEGRLWGRVQQDLTARSGEQISRHRSSLAVAAAAVVTAGLAGILIWATSHGGPQPVPGTPRTMVATASSSVPATGSSTGKRQPPTSQPPTSPATTSTRTTGSAKTTALPALSLRDLLTAEGYRGVGWVVESVQVGDGWGQSTIATCEDIPGVGGPGTSVVRGDGYAAVEDAQLATGQFVLDLDSSVQAKQLVRTVLQWPEGCANLDRQSLKGVVVKSSPPRSVRLPGDSEGHWYTMTFSETTTRRTELIAVARTAERVSIVVLTQSTPVGAIDAVDGDKLVRRAVDRLH